MILPVAIIDFLTPGVRELFCEGKSYKEVTRILEKVFKDKKNKKLKQRIENILDIIIINEFKEFLKLKHKLKHVLI